jgi:predicted RNA-binding Zn-ribbon protein involved in translation (DUF1610 family)
VTTPAYTAKCTACGTAFRVPAEDRVYKCKRCGGSVRVAPDDLAPEPEGEAESEPEGEAALASCAQCDAILPHGARHCPECGREVRAPARPSGSDAPDERVLAAKDLHAARRAVTVVSRLLLVNAVAYGVYTVVLVFRLVDPEVSFTAGLVSFARPLALLVLSAAAIAQVALHPLPWSIGIASLWSVDSVLLFWSARVSSVALVIRCALVVALWLSVLPTVRVARLLERYPGAYASRAFLGVYASASIGAKELRQLAARTAWKRSGQYAAAALAVVALAVSIVWFGMRPQLLGPSLESFVGAWNRDQLREVAAAMEPEAGASLRTRVEKVRAARRWTTLPHLASPPAEALATQFGPKVVELRLENSSDTLESRWERSGRGWILAHLELPPPPLAPAVEAFTRAWNASDADRLAELFQGDLRLRARSYLEQLREKRHWTAGLPHVGTNSVLPISRRYADVWLVSDSGRFRTRWALDDDDLWGIVTLDPPDE